MPEIIYAFLIPPTIFLQYRKNFATEHTSLEEEQKFSDWRKAVPGATYM